MIDLAAICRFFPGEAAHIGVFSSERACQDKAHFKRNNLNVEKELQRILGGTDALEQGGMVPPVRHRLPNFPDRESFLIRPTFS